MSNAMDLTEEVYVAELDSAIDCAISDGFCTLEDIAARCDGAGLEVVENRLTTRGLLDIANLAREARENAQVARVKASQVLAQLPAPDPERAQWWFTLDTIESLSAELARHAKRRPIALLGTPTLAVYLRSRYNISVDLFDSDSHVLDAVNKEDGEVATHLYTVRDQVCEKKFSVICADPPWYPTEMEYFAARASSLCEQGGFFLLTIPGILTRPNAAQERKELFSKWLADFSLTSVSSQSVIYKVPAFEDFAHKSLHGFSGKPWRSADLATLQKVQDSGTQTLPYWDEPDIQSFAKNPKELRLFLAKERISPGLLEPINTVSEYTGTTSRRDSGRKDVAIWSSTKKGFRVRKFEAGQAALEIWAEARSSDEAVKQTSDPEVLHILNHLYSVLQLPADTRDNRLTPPQMKERFSQVLTQWATTPLDRPKPEISDQYRLPHQRDRDRILWSDGIKRLAHKTQMFSLEESDNVRQRLAHSIEVMQLATTVSATLGLDRDLVEAGALAHDIGHTPFGHAGEHALNTVIRTINSGIGGFTHYEHGIDVIRWLESSYRSKAVGGLDGLNLTRGVAECIFKHTYCLGGDRIGQRELWEQSKYRENWPELAGDTPCHLEGQAVRVADKISYLISDLEDGLRLGALRIADLRACRLFQHAPLDLQTDGDSDLECYISQRRALINLLMEDVIDSTAKRLSQTTPSRLRSVAGYTVDHSPTISAEVSEVWNRLQAGMLHKHPRVVDANLQAGRIVTSLFILFAVQPSLVDSEFSRSHRQLKDTNYIRWYQNRMTPGKRQRFVEIPERLVASLGLDTTIGSRRTHEDAQPESTRPDWQVLAHDFVMAKDYVASLSDSRAKRLFRTLLNP